MTPQPPSSPEDPTSPPEPSREKDPAPAGRLETDLWDLDEQAGRESPGGTDPEPKRAGEIKEAAEPVKIEPRIIARETAGNAPKKTVRAATTQAETKARTAPPQKTGMPGAEGTSSTTLSSDFDDLDVLDGLDDLDDPDLRDEETALEPGPSDLSAGSPAKETPPPEAAVETRPESPTDTADPPLAETTSPPAAPTVAGTGVSLLLRPLLTLSRLEKIGLVALLAVLATGTLLILGHWLTRLPAESHGTQGPDFPITGETITAVSADTYWRAPVTEGPDADRFRRGTQLLPVADLALDGGPGAIRVFFRNGEKGLEGDVITRAVSGATSMKIAATAGFDDIAMHAAYHTGGSKPWVVQVFEGPSVNAPSSEFQLLFETSVSSNRR